MYLCDWYLLNCDGSSAYPTFNSSCLSFEQKEMRDFQCQTKWGCGETWCHLCVLGSDGISRRTGLSRLFILHCVSLATRMSTQARGASSPTVGSREQPPTPTFFLDAPMRPTQVTPRRPVGLSSAVTVGAARQAMGFGRGCTRTSAGSWR